MPKFPKNDKDYVALARTILQGETPHQELAQVMLDLTNKTQNIWTGLAKSDPKATFAWLLFPLGVWYLALKDLKKGRYSIESPEAKVVFELRNAILSVVLPRIAKSLDVGDHTAFSCLAAVIEFAKDIPDLGDLDKMDQAMLRLGRALGLPQKKFQKKTQRLRALLPLWSLGFGKLPYPEKVKIFEQAGLSESEVPEEDALRKFLSDHKVPALLSLLQSKNPHP